MLLTFEILEFEGQTDGPFIVWPGSSPELKNIQWLYILVTTPATPVQESNQFIYIWFECWPTDYFVNSIYCQMQILPGNLLDIVHNIETTPYIGKRTKTN